MILSRAPVRITLGGGGTDLKSYYSKYGGFLIAAGINRYCSIVAEKRFKGDFRLAYSETETCNRVEQIKHNIFREAIKYIGIDGGIELHSISNVPSGSGLGSSSSFTVALLNVLHTYKKEFITQRELASEACQIEIDILKNPIGKQDQYMAAFGGLTCLTFEKDGSVLVESLKVSDETIERLEDNLQFFYTGIERNANDVLIEQDTKSQSNDFNMLDNLNKIKDIGLLTRKALENGHVDMLGDFFKAHWELKKKRSNKMTNQLIDEAYEDALKNGATGGKLMGAGGGGFFMFYCLNGNKPRLNQAMKRLGLRPMRFRFDMEGTKILVNT